MWRLPWRLPLAPTPLRAALASAIVVPIHVGIVADPEWLAVSIVPAGCADVPSLLPAWRRVGAGGAEVPR